MKPTEMCDQGHEGKGRDSSWKCARDLRHGTDRTGSNLMGQI